MKLHHTMVHSKHEWTFWLTSTARECPAGLARTWKRRTAEAFDWPPSREVPPLCTTIGCPPKILMRWGGSLPSITRTFINIHIQTGVTSLFCWYMSRMSNSALEGLLYCRGPVLMKHPNLLIKVFRITRNLQTSMLGQVGAKLYRTFALQEQEWTPLVYVPADIQ